LLAITLYQSLNLKSISYTKCKQAAWAKKSITVQRLSACFVNKFSNGFYIFIHEGFCKTLLGLLLKHVHISM